MKDSWNSLCADSIRRERAEIEKRYGIRFGQTEIYCVRCGRPVTNPLNHACQDIRLKKLQKGKKNAKKTPKMDVSLSMDDFVDPNAPGGI